MDKSSSRKEFILDCMRRGMPPDKIVRFLLELGIDKKTAKSWVEPAKREFGHGFKSSHHGGNTKTIEGKPPVDYDVPQLETRSTILMGQHAAHESLINPHSVSIELETKSATLKKIDLLKSASSMLVGSSGRDFEVSAAPLAPLESAGARERLSRKVELETQVMQQEKKGRKSKRKRKGLLGTPQARLALFAAGVLLAWLLSDAGWLPGGSGRPQFLPPPDSTAEPPLAKAPESPRTPSSIAPKSKGRSDSVN